MRIKVHVDIALPNGIKILMGILKWYVNTA